jgi:signal transduction histidine kinase
LIGEANQLANGPFGKVTTGDEPSTLDFSGDYPRPIAKGNRPPVDFGETVNAWKYWPRTATGPNFFARCCVSSVLAILLCVASRFASAQIVHYQKVLIITEVGFSHPAMVMIMQSLSSTLQARADWQVELYTESLDAMTSPTKGEQDAIRAQIVKRYENQNIDLIVAAGPSPVKFLAERQAIFLPDVPIIICATSEERAGYPKLGKRFTGTWVNFVPEKTLEVALSLLPTTEQVVVVGGTSDFDRSSESAIEQRMKPYEKRLRFTYLTDLTMTDLVERLHRLPPRTIVLYSSFWRDAAGRQFVNATVALPMIAKASNAPVFGFSDTYLGHGIVGGNIHSYAEQGRIAARIASEILNGKKAAEIPIVSGSNQYVFDWRELERWGLTKATLPTGSIVLNREPTIWEGNKRAVTAALLVILCLFVLTGYLLLEKKRLQVAKNALLKLSGSLINAQENERHRLARELHDDFSQRMAVLSVGLEMATDKISDSPEEARVELHKLLNSAGEIGEDLHAVSHRLHSSTLDKLGLVAGVSSYCKEFTATQNIEVGFSHNEIPGSIPSDAALCLFRIVQEALRNVKKHSGATTAQVDLQASGDHLQLDICDEGSGFDTNQVRGDNGIGISSMTERVRLLEGRLTIHSELNKGSRISASIPLHPTKVAQATSVKKKSNLAMGV